MIFCLVIRAFKVTCWSGRLCCLSLHPSEGLPQHKHCSIFPLRGGALSRQGLHHLLLWRAAILSQGLSWAGQERALAEQGLAAKPDSGPAPCPVWELLHFPERRRMTQTCICLSITHWWGSIVLCLEWQYQSRNSDRRHPLSSWGHCPVTELKLYILLVWSYGMAGFFFFLFFLFALRNLFIPYLMLQALVWKLKALKENVPP